MQWLRGGTLEPGFPSFRAGVCDLMALMTLDKLLTSSMPLVSYLYTQDNSITCILHSRAASDGIWLWVVKSLRPSVSSLIKKTKRKTSIDDSSFIIL